MLLYKMDFCWILFFFVNLIFDSNSLYILHNVAELYFIVMVQGQ